MSRPRLPAACALLAVTAVAALGCDEKHPLPEPAPAASATASAAASAAATGPKVYEHVVLSKEYEVDRLYRSMEGPSSVQRVALGPEPHKRELLWIVGFEALMVDPVGDNAVSQEFMCHTNLDVDVLKHQETFADDKPITGRLFTLSQGQYRIDLPPGTGIPIVSDELLDVNTQVLNLNQRDGKRSVRHRVTLRFVRDGELDGAMKPLFVAGAYGLKLLEGTDGHYGRAGSPHGEQQGGECLPGENAGKHELGDGQGRTFTGHWVVPPGREVNHTRVTELMNLPFDTRVHYVAVHLHPFAESLELRDLTTGETVYRARTRQAEVGIGLAHVDFYASAEGFPVFKDHEYEIVSVYNNTSSEPQDSMAVLNLYMHDVAFRRPDLSAAPKAAPEPGAKPASSASAGPAGGPSM